MNQATLAKRRSTPVSVLAAVALLGALLVATNTADPAHGEQHGHSQAAMATPRGTAEVRLHDAMRKLWEDHVAWTRLAIVGFADGSPGFDATATRLLQNQVDIGDAIKPFYGRAAGEQLTALLHDHIIIAVDLLQAAKAGDTAAFDDAHARWYANSNDIADFLARANPHSWNQDVMRAEMKEHLDVTLAEASDELNGDYAGSVADYDAIEQHILGMADMLSSGIIAQFPNKVR